MDWVHLTGVDQIAVQLLWPVLVRQCSTSVALADTGPRLIKYVFVSQAASGRGGSVAPEQPRT